MNGHFWYTPILKVTEKVSNISVDATSAAVTLPLSVFCPFFTVFCIDLLVKKKRFISRKTQDLYTNICGILELTTEI